MYIGGEVCPVEGVNHCVFHFTTSLKMAIVLHCGAGSYRNKKADAEFVELMDKALLKGLDLLASNKSAAFVACAVAAELEASRFTNAGFGSNLTKNGTVECDATVAIQRERDEDPSFASLGAVCGIDSPSLAVLRLCEEADDTSVAHESRVRMLVGKEAWKWALHRNLSSAEDESSLQSFQVTYGSVAHWNAALSSTQIDDGDTSEHDQKRSRADDTIGCLCIDKAGTIAGVCSSGGPVLRTNGRVGPAGVWGAGVFVTKDRVACTTGASDPIVRRMLARACCESQELKLPFRDETNLGALRLIKNGNSLKAEWAFTSTGLALGYASISAPSDRKCFVSRKAFESNGSVGSWETKIS